MSANSSSTNGGISILGLLGIAFVVLKLTGYIDWSWFWVTAPFWGLFALVIAVVVIAAAIKLIAVLATRKKKPKQAHAQRTGSSPVSSSRPSRGTVSNPTKEARREPVINSTVSQPPSSSRREAPSSLSVRNSSHDDIYTNPLHPLNPTSQAIYAASDDTPSRSHCSSHTSHGGYSESSYSSSSDSSCTSSSDSTSSSSSSD
jgi:uncharacterized membrane protein